MSRDPPHQKSNASSLSSPLPHLSHSRISKYLLCPEQYRLYYIDNLKPRYPAASLVFGQLLHQVLAGLFQTGTDPVDEFLKGWDGTKDAGLTYRRRDTWESLRVASENLLQKFVAEELPKLKVVEAAETSFELDITSLEFPFVGIIDLVAQVDGKRTVIDFKSSGSKYPEHEASMSDQLTAYQLAEPEAQQTALCVLIKTKEPKIEWHVAERSGDELAEYLAKVGLVSREIAARHFYKRPGPWCAWCDYLPVCIGDLAAVKRDLVKLG